MFNTDLFTLNALTAAINAIPYVPTHLAQLGLFDEEGVPTTTVSIEEENGTVALVATASRGSPGQTVATDKRKARTFQVPHLPQTDRLLADSVQGVRAFGSTDGAQPVEIELNKRLGKMARNVDFTLEYHRVGAIKGLILDKDGSTIFNLFTEFGLVQQTVGMALPTTSTEIRVKALEVLDAIEDELDGVPMSGVRALCGKDFWAALISHPKVKEVYLSSSRVAEISGDPREEFEFAGIVWARYRGKVGGAGFIGNDDAYAVPMGVPDLFITRFAPADYNETVNTIGLPRYANSELMPMSKGYYLEAQSNPLNLCTRPRAVIKLTKV